MTDPQTMVEYDMSTLDKVDEPTVGNIINAINQIAAILIQYPCDNPIAGEYNHQFQIYLVAMWLKLDTVTGDVSILDPGAFTGTTLAQRYQHEKEVKSYDDYQKHKFGTIQMLQHVFWKITFCRYGK